MQTSPSPAQASAQAANDLVIERITQSDLLQIVLLEAERRRIEQSLKRRRESLLTRLRAGAAIEPGRWCAAVLCAAGSVDVVQITDVARVVRKLALCLFP